MKTLYPTKFKYRGGVKILLWKEGGDCEDRFLLDGDGELIRGENVEELRELADRVCNPDSVDWSYDYTGDIDKITEALLALTPGEEVPANTYDLLLNGWNFINDLLYSIYMPRTYEEQNNEDLNHTYEKTFLGNNLEPLTPPGESWHPAFSEHDIISVQEFFISTLATLEKEKLI